MDRREQEDFNAARDAFRRFRSGINGERLFVHPAAHPSEPSPFCPSAEGPLRAALLYLRAAVLERVMDFPFNGLKIWLLRRCGARVGKNVFISPHVWIDPLFPELLRLEDGAFIGMFAKIATHEFRMAEFRAGRVVIGERAVICGAAIIACGVEIGAGATVAGGAVVGRDVPAGATAIGNPARVCRASALSVSQT